MENKIQKTHATHDNYIDVSQVNQKESYRLESKALTYGGMNVYQHIVMNDGTIYELSSQTASTRGIIASNVKQKNMLQRDLKQYTRQDNVINY